MEEFGEWEGKVFFLWTWGGTVAICTDSVFCVWDMYVRGM